MAEWIPLPITAGPPKKSQTEVTPTSRATLEKTSTKATEQQVSVAALDALLPVVYGSRPIQALVANVFAVGSHWLFWVLWCEGEITAIDEVLMNDAELPSGTVITNYTGTQSQGIDPALVTAFGLLSPSVLYDEHLYGIAYSVINVPSRFVTSAPKFTAKVRGLKVYDPRTTLTAFSRNPSLQAAHFITNDVFGAGLDVDWASVEVAADANDTVYGAYPDPTDISRQSDLYIDKESSVDNHMETFRAVANVFFINNQGVIKFVPDVTGSSVATYSHNSGNIIDLTNIEMAAPQSLPTVIDVVYTDTSKDPWTDATATYKRALVDEGITPWRFSSVPMRWITSSTQARREAYERGNKIWLRSLKFDLHIFDEGLQHEPGDIITITWPDAGFVDLLARVTSVAPTNQGWMLGCVKEDPNAYDYSVVAAPTSPNTNLPLPNDPPQVGTVTVTEELYQLQDGTYSSRLRATWDEVQYPFIDHYRIIVWQGGVNVFTGTTSAESPVYVTPPVQEKVPYQFDVQIVSTTGIIGAAGANSPFTPQGKYLLPGNVPSIKGFEASGRVYLWWTAATDIDIWKYEVRYGTTTGTWDSATLVDRLDGLSKVVEGLAAGTWRFYVKAVDSVGGYSPTAIYIDLVVTLDNNAFLLQEFQFRYPTLTNVTAVPMRGDTVQYVIDFGDGIGYGHTQPDNTLDDFIDASNIVNYSFNRPHTAGTGTYQTNAWDIGLVVTGNVTFIPNVIIDNGTVTTYIDVSLDGSTWTPTTGTSYKGTFRFVRGRVVSTAAFSIIGYPTARVDVVPRTETFANKTSLAYGPYKITLVNKYAVTKSIIITPLGTVARTFAVDNIVLGTGTNSFDVYMFDSSGNQVASSFDARFEGI